jgi:hypothetical protein
MFRITGLAAAPFLPLFDRPDSELAALGIRRYTVDSCPGFPDRIEMREASIGDTVLLLNHVSQPADTPYRASHAIYLRKGATATYDAVDQVPESMRIRLLSLRGFADDGMMRAAEVVDGSELEAVIAAMFADPDVAYIHAHNAKRGCYAGRIDRA